MAHFVYEFSQANMDSSDNEYDCSDDDLERLPTQNTKDYAIFLGKTLKKTKLLVYQSQHYAQFHRKILKKKNGRKVAECLAAYRNSKNVFQIGEFYTKNAYLTPI